MLNARRLRLYLNLEVLLRSAVAPGWVAGALFAAWRLLVGRSVAAAGAGLAVAGAAACLARFRRAAWSDPQARVALDRIAGAGGLSLALAEARGPGWEPGLQEKLAAARLPRRALARPAAALAGALAFAGVAALAPLPRPRGTPVQTAALAKVEALAARAEALAQEDALGKDLAAELARLKEDAQASRFDAADWAGADALAEAVAQAAALRAQDLSSAAEAADKLSRALEEGAGAEREARQREALEQALMGMAAREPGGRPGGDGAQARAQRAAAGVHGAADARALREALARRAFRVARSGGASGLVAYDFTPGARGARGEGEDEPGERAQAGEGQPGAARPGEDQGRDPGGQASGEQQGAGKSRSGGGGPSRGPGAAPVTFGEPTPMQLERLQADALPPNANDAQGALTGVSAAAPEVKPAGPGAPGAAAGGGEGLGAHEGPLSPRQRALLKRYFEPRSGGNR